MNALLIDWHILSIVHVVQSMFMLHFTFALKCFHHLNNNNYQKHVLLTLQTLDNTHFAMISNGRNNHVLPTSKSKISIVITWNCDEKINAMNILCPLF